MQIHLSSNTKKLPKQVKFYVKMKGEYASIVRFVDASFRNFNSPTSEIVKQVWSLSNKLNFGQVKLEQFQTSYAKHVVFIHD
jgi:hypothetical protein